MLTFLAGKLTKNETSPARQRQIYGMLCGLAGIFLNIALFAGKFFAGRISHSIAITADAFNNLSDAASSAVTLAGFQLAGTKPDTKHPFGHGRIEYIAGLVVAAAILIMAFELIQDSFYKILHPVPTEFHIISAAVLVVSILVKLYMAYYNRRIGKKIDSAAMRAAAADSLSDALATSVVLASAWAGDLTGLYIDGYCGLLVGAFIFYTGIAAAKETLDPLLGQPPEQEFVDRIYEIVIAHAEVLGIHDLIVHNYGPGRQMISLHAEVPADADILEVHDMIDRIESELKQKLYCEAVIHMDPIVKDEKTDRLRQKMNELARRLGEGFSIHDFRMVPGKTHTNLIFDLVVPFSYRQSDEEAAEMLQKKADAELGETYHLKIKVDRA